MLSLTKLVIEKKSFSLYKKQGNKAIKLTYGKLIPSNGTVNDFLVSDYEGNRYTFDNPTTNEYSNIKEELIDTDFIAKLEHNTSIKSTSKETFTKNVSRGIDKIINTNLNKVVCSKVKTTSNTTDSILETFELLIQNYPEAFVCLFYDSKIGCWLGATPEILLNSDTDSIKTVALAGTQLALDKTVKQAAWSQKEIEEQALVSRYIINCFKKIRLREFSEKGPKTIQTGKLFHLKTEYTIHKKETNIKNLEEQLLTLLHPTSAVCGMPKELAQQELKETETHNRSLYTGFWGTVEPENQDLFVNIRVAQLFKNEIIFYSGAGITEDSNPDMEWSETEAKCNNLALLFK